MREWMVVLLLIGSNVGTRAFARAVIPKAGVAWTTPHLLTWVFWLVVIVPGVLVVWSRVDRARTEAKFRRRLDAWLRERGPVRPLARSLVDAEQLALVQELAAALEPRRSTEPPVAAFLDATQAWLAAAGFGSGAFHGDGWAALGRTERWNEAKQAADALP